MSAFSRPPVLLIGSSGAGIPSIGTVDNNTPRLIQGEISGLAASSNSLFVWDLGPNWADYTRIQLVVYIAGGDTGTASPSNAISMGLDQSASPYNRAISYSGTAVATIGSQAVPSYNITLFAVTGRYIMHYIQNASTTSAYSAGSYVKLVVSN